MKRASPNISSSVSSPFEGFPPEIVERFLLKLPIEHIKQLCQVNKQVEEVCSSEHFWKQLVQRDFSRKNISLTIGYNLELDQKYDNIKGIDSYRCLYQTLQMNIYILNIVMMGDDDYPDSNAQAFLSIDDAIKVLINEAEHLGDLFKLADLDPKITDEFSNDDFRKFMESISKDVDKKNRFEHVRRMAHSHIKDWISEQLSTGGHFYATTDDNTYYILPSKLI